ncbi:MAG: phosphoribosylglycinamide formyltransferase [Christensenellaceae bacterium]|jgi:phosphoribosylglycinamide formyltransferase-1|nr:phosphoribosylglycinamide formyltransferase [Christensenellaceae bacterium]
MKKKLAVFVSGGGTNFRAILNAIDAGRINASVELVISSSPQAGALEIASDCNIKTVVLDTNPGNLDMVYATLCDQIVDLDIDFIVLAGYIKILPHSFVSKFLGRIINIHPALIPSYSGKGFYGKRVHQAVIDGGEMESGCTVHFVDFGIDTGEIIAQARVPVFQGDTADTLAARVLVEEHKLLPQALAKLCAE